MQEAPVKIELGGRVFKEIASVTGRRYIVFGSGLPEEGYSKLVRVIDPNTRAMKSNRPLETSLEDALVALTSQGIEAKHGTPDVRREGVAEDVVVVGVLLAGDIEARVVDVVSKLDHGRNLQNFRYTKVSRWQKEADIGEGVENGEKKRGMEWRVYTPDLDDQEVSQTILAALVGRCVGEGERSGGFTSLLDDNLLVNYAPGLLVTVYGDVDKCGDELSDSFTFGRNAVSLWQELNGQKIDKGTVVLPNQELLNQSQRAHGCVFGFVKGEKDMRLVMSFYGGSSFDSKFDFAEAASRAGIV